MTNHYFRGTALSIAFVLLCFNLACKKTASSGGSEVEEDEITYEASSEIFPNPERGFTKTLPVYSGGPQLDLVQLKALRNQNITLIVRVIYLDQYKDKPIDASQLTLIQTDLDYLRQAGLKGVIRFAYTDDMKGTDAPLAIVEEHLDQLKTVFEANKDIIAFVQAGFIGAWGEWHSSSNGLTSTENQQKVLTKLLRVLPKEIMVQVRTPLQKQQVFNTTTPVNKAQGFSQEDLARVGHHNDCFLSSADDYGTYVNVSAEKQYISNEALYVPVGGETCPPLAGFSASCAEGRSQMKLLKWTYINLDYYVPTINAWRSSGCFEEFQRNLGYRLALASSTITRQVPLNGSLKLAINIINNGYAPVYNRKITSLVFRNKATNSLYEKQLAYDIRECKPSTTANVNETINLSGLPSGEYALYLQISDDSESLKKRVEYSVRLANKDGWTEENGGMNDLKSSLTIL